MTFMYQALGINRNVFLFLLQNVYYVIKASLSILHNIARNPDVKHYFKEHKTSEVSVNIVNLLHYFNSPNLYCMLTSSTS